MGKYLVVCPCKGTRSNNEKEEAIDKHNMKACQNNYAE